MSDTLTVRDLLSLLEDMPKDAEVYVTDGADDESSSTVLLGTFTFYEYFQPAQLWLNIGMDVEAVRDDTRG